MGTFYQQVLTLLTSPPGNLAYHLVIVFSIAGALPGSINLWRGTDSPQGRRMAIGLSLLLIAQLALIVDAGLAQFFSLPEMALPSLDRAVNAFSLVVLIWLWAFPDPQRLADTGTFLLGLLVLILFIFSTAWGARQATDIPYNGSLLDQLWGVFSLILAFLGIMLLLVRRPVGYGIGLGMFALLFIGQMAHLLAPLPAGDFPGVVRLFQMAAYPLLLTMPYRYSLAGAGLKNAGPLQGQAGLPPEVFRSFMELVAGSNPQEMCPGIARSVSYALSADLCLLISPPDLNRIISIHCGYDQSRAQALGAATFDSSLVPVLSEALRQNRPLHLPAGGNLPDLDNVGKILDLPLAGSLLEAPISGPGGSLAMAILLLSPYSKRVWTSADQNYLADIAKSLAGILQRAQEKTRLADQIAQSNRALANLQSENERLSLALQDLPPSQGPGEDEVEELRAQLRLALEEITHLQSALAEAGPQDPTRPQGSTKPVNVYQGSEAD